jgi:hypothetical protein
MFVWLHPFVYYRYIENDILIACWLTIAKGLALELV